MTIAKSVITLTDFPWGALSIKMPAISKELKVFGSLLNVFEKNRYVGFVVNGNSREFPNLTYLNTQLHIGALKNQSMSNYVLIKF